MIYNEKYMNLFDEHGYYLVHCISNDFKMGKGIAVIFTYLGVKQYLIDNYKGNNFTNGYCILTSAFNGSDKYNGVFNLVTKRFYYEKPSLKTIRESLIDMKSKLPIDCKKIAMPKIGCGLDRLNWEHVKPIIFEVFSDTDIEILVCIR